MKSKMNSTTQEVSYLFKEGHFVLKCLSTRTTWSGEKAFRLMEGYIVSIKKFYNYM